MALPLTPAHTRLLRGEASPTGNQPLWQRDMRPLAPGEPWEQVVRTCDPAAPTWPHSPRFPERRATLPTVRVGRPRRSVCYVRALGMKQRCSALVRHLSLKKKEAFCVFPAHRHQAGLKACLRPEGLAARALRDSGGQRCPDSRVSLSSTGPRPVISATRSYCVLASRVLPRCLCTTGPAATRVPPG